MLNSSFCIIYCHHLEKRNIPALRNFNLLFPKDWALTNRFSSFHLVKGGRWVQRRKAGAVSCDPCLWVDFIIPRLDPPRLLLPHTITLQTLICIFLFSCSFSAFICSGFSWWKTTIWLVVNHLNFGCYDD